MIVFLFRYMEKTYIDEILTFLLVGAILLNEKLVAGLPIPASQDIDSVCTKYSGNLIEFSWDLNKSTTAALTHEVCVCSTLKLFQTDYEVTLQLLYTLKYGLIMGCQLPAPFGCFCSIGKH